MNGNCSYKLSQTKIDGLIVFFDIESRGLGTVGSCRQFEKRWRTLRSKK